MGNFFTDVIQRDPRYRSTTPVNDWALIEPGFRAKAQAIITAAAAEGIELVSTETYRSSERQQQLFDQGKTRLRVVGVHHYGLAVDFAKRVDGKLTWDGDWTFLCKMAADAGVVAGGDWGLPDKPHSFRDWDHLQGVTLAEQAKLFAGMWYPGATIGVGAAAALPVIAAAKPVPPPVPARLTVQQAKILTVADQVNAEYFGNWFLRSSIMAYCEVESSFDERAIRHEPSGVTSYGVMQVLDSTAAWLGLVGSPEQMYDPLYGLFYGLKNAAWGWNYLTTALGRPPTLEEWSDGYNEGYGAAARGRDVPYSDRWMAARERWIPIVDIT